MKREEILELTKLYQKKLDQLGIKPKMPKTSWKGVHYKLETLEYCHELLQQIHTLVGLGHLALACTQLGFVKGCFWIYGMYSLDQMNKDDPSR